MPGVGERVRGRHPDQRDKPEELGAILNGFVEARRRIDDPLAGERCQEALARRLMCGSGHANYFFRMPASRADTV